MPADTLDSVMIPLWYVPYKRLCHFRAWLFRSSTPTIAQANEKLEAICWKLSFR